MDRKKRNDHKSSKTDDSAFEDFLTVHRDPKRSIPLFGKVFSTPKTAIQEESQRMKTQNVPLAPLVGLELERFQCFGTALSLIFSNGLALEISTENDRLTAALKKSSSLSSADNVGSLNVISVDRTSKIFSAQTVLAPFLCKRFDGITFYSGIGWVRFQTDPQLVCIITPILEQDLPLILLDTE